MIHPGPAAIPCLSKNRPKHKKQHLRCDVCLEVKSEDYQNCSVLCLVHTACPEKNGTNNVLGITVTKFNKFSQFLAQFMRTYQLTKKL